MASIGTTGAILPSWFKKMNTNSNGGQTLSVSIDSAGYVYACGVYLAGSAFTFAGVTLPASPTAALRTGFYAKFAADGTLQWIKTIKSANSYVFCNAIAVDDDHLFLSGAYVSNATISLDNDVSLPISVGVDGFILSISKSDGTTQWGLRVGGGNNDQQTAISMDSSKVYFAGSYSQAITFNANASLPNSYVGADSCIIAIDKSTGVVSWAKCIPGLSTAESALGVAAYGSAVYLSAFYSNTITQTLQVSPAVTIPPSKTRTGGGGTTTPILVKYNTTDGTIAWVKYFETDRDQSMASCVAADSTGVYIGGNYCLYAAADLGNSVTLPASLSDVAGNQNTAFVIKYNHSGVAQWARVINSAQGYSSIATVITDANYVYLGGGYFSTSVNTSFNPLVSFPANTAQGAFLYCCDTAGNPVWTDVLINSVNTTTYGIAKASDGIVVAYRQGGGGGTIGNGLIPAYTGAASPLIVKYNVTNPVITAANVNSVVASAVAVPNNAGAAAQIQTTTTALANANVVQKISDTKTAIITGKASGVTALSGSALSSGVPIVASADNVVAINSYVPASASVNSVTIAVSNITDPAVINQNISTDTSLYQITKIAVIKYNEAGTEIHSEIGNSETYDTIQFNVNLNASGVFGFIHTGNDGVKTLLVASVDLKTVAIGSTITLSGAADATMKVISRSGNDIKIEYFGPFSEILGTPIGAGSSLIQQGDTVILTSGAVPCFTAGTKILTPTGYRRIETISVGDKVTTADGRVVPAVVYQRKLLCANEKTAPYHIPAGTFGRSQPEDLLISPLHAVQLRKGVWEIPRDAADRYPAITQKMVGEPITYYHIETPNYFRDNLVANGCVVESFGMNQAKRIPNGVSVYRYNAKIGGFTRYSPGNVATKQTA